MDLQFVRPCDIKYKIQPETGNLRADNGRPASDVYGRYSQKPTNTIS